MVRDNALEDLIDVYEEHGENDVYSIAILNRISDAGQAIHRDGDRDQIARQNGRRIRPNARDVGEIFHHQIRQDGLLTIDVGTRDLADNVLQIRDGVKRHEIRGIWPKRHRVGRNTKAARQVLERDDNLDQFKRRSRWQRSGLYLVLHDLFG